jgi:hypothetical protein
MCSVRVGGGIEAVCVWLLLDKKAGLTGRLLYEWVVFSTTLQLGSPPNTRVGWNSIDAVNLVIIHSSIRYLAEGSSGLPLSTLPGW